MRRYVFLCHLISAAVAMTILLGCASGATAKRRLGMPSYPPTDWRHVAVVGILPKGEYEVMGEVYGSGNEFSDLGRVGNRMRQAAAEIGGDAIVIAGEGYDRTATMQPGYKGGLQYDLRAPRASGIVIRFMDRRLGAPPKKGGGGEK